MLSANLAALSLVVTGVVFLIATFTWIVDFQKETAVDYEQARKLKIVTQVSVMVLLICVICTLLAYDLHL
jgi:hypothetical protein